MTKIKQRKEQEPLTQQKRQADVTHTHQGVQSMGKSAGKDSSLSREAGFELQCDHRPEFNKKLFL